MEGSLIAWTDNTFNPAMGCVKVSPGCTHCYAETLTKNRMGLHLWGAGSRRQVTTDANWKKPIQWQKQAQSEGRRLKVFCASLCDVFEEHPTIDGMRPRLWDLIRRCDKLDWQLLTKRPERIASYLPPDWGIGGWHNVWLGTSIENNDYIQRADVLRQIPATVRFISYEPALGPLTDIELAGIDWLIYGGESGSGYRMEDKQWARDIMAKCRESGTAFFHKQSAGYKTEMGIELDGVIVREYPTPRVLHPQESAVAVTKS